MRQQPWDPVNSELVSVRRLPPQGKIIVDGAARRADGRSVDEDRRGRLAGIGAKDVDGLLGQADGLKGNLHGVLFP